MVNTLTDNRYMPVLVVKWQHTICVILCTAISFHLLSAAIGFRIIFYHAIFVQIALAASSSASKLIDICFMSQYPSISLIALFTVLKLRL